MREKKETYEIAITISEFGSLEKFYKTFAKRNRKILVDNIEFEGTDEQHNTGIMYDKIYCTPSKLKQAVGDYVYKNSLNGECFSVTKEGKKKVILDETKI